jgi:C4-dicarboxylate transporter DctQ subunit
LLLFRFVQATIRLIRGEADSLIVSHEAEDEVDAVKHINKGD